MIYDGKHFNSLSLIDQQITNLEFNECTFHKCTIQESTLTNCIFKQCQFINCHIINNTFNQTVSLDNSFLNCSLISVNWSDLIGESYLHYPFSSFEHCVLKYSIFFKLKLKNFDFSDCDFNGAIFEECDLTKTNFNKAILKETLFTNCNLMYADFREAKDYFIDPRTNQLKNAKFSFPEAISLLSVFEIIID